MKRKHIVDRRKKTNKKNRENVTNEVDAMTLSPDNLFPQIVLFVPF